VTAANDVAANWGNKHCRFVCAVSVECAKDILLGLSYVNSLAGREPHNLAASNFDIGGLAEFVLLGCGEGCL
jgi:hypothetical protein